jgi:hypothetical protein
VITVGPVDSYQAELAAANRIGSARATDAGVMAQFCATSLQLIVGAASPELVWIGAQKAGMTALELVTLANKKPLAVHDLMWG